MQTLTEVPPLQKPVATGRVFPTNDQVDASARVWGRLVIAVTVGSNAALLIAQQVAFRLLSPLIGSSIETWSTIIGVFLFGIAVGNRVAGKLTDYYSSPRLVVCSLGIGAFSLFAMPWLTDWLAISPSFASWSLDSQIIVASIVVCLFPGVALSLVTQPSLRSLMTRADQVGSASGNVFAWGTFGSLFGNYLAGFVLLALVGVRGIVWMTACSILALAAVTMLAGRRQLLDVKPKGPSIFGADLNWVDRTSSDESPEPWHLRALLIVVVCSFVSGALEGAAFRILAPLVGMSMFLTAGVVGAVLAGMSIGNAYGGRLATRYGTLNALRNSLAVCAVTTLLVAPFWKMAVNTRVFHELGLMPQVVLWSFTLFFLPAMALGTITPQVIKLSVREMDHVGTIAGKLYAWSTLGCIAGILASSWWLIEAIGGVRTSIVCGILPVLLMWLVRPEEKVSTSPQQATKHGLSWALIVFSIILLFGCKSPYDRESKYFCLDVRDGVIEGREVKKLVLDRLVHSAIDLNDPTFLHYRHERIQGDLTRAASEQNLSRGAKTRILIIGGGGYSFPRWVESQVDLDDVQIDVVEIDPEVTEIAHDQLGLPRTTRINSIHMDGRQFVKSAEVGSYDLVIQDAVNDLSVPYHLMTSEYNGLVQRILKPDGVYLLTVIDALESGRFLASAIRTMRNVYSDTRLLVPQESATSRIRSVFVIGGRQPSPQGGESSAMEWWTDRTSAHIFPDAEVEDLLRRQGAKSPLLTDDFAPVDNLMTGQFLRN